MTIEQALQKCIKDYTIGAKYIGLRDGKEEIVERIPTIFTHASIEAGIDFIYKDGKFAEIVSTPKQKSKFEVGKWYKKNGFYGKLTAPIDGDIFPSKEYIYNKQYKSSGNHFSDWDNAELVDLSEIQQYLPSDHIDKIKKEDSIPEYVECIKNENLDRQYIVGKIYKVVESNEYLRDGLFRIEGETFTFYGVTTKSFKPSTKKAYDAQFNIKTEDILDLSYKKIHIGNDLELRKKVLEKAKNLGWNWLSGRNPEPHKDEEVQFWPDKNITHSSYPFPDSRFTIITTDKMGIIHNIKLEEDLSGRWLKALVDYPNGISRLEKGEYAQIEINGLFKPIKGFPGHIFSKERIGIEWELMPEGFSPTNTIDLSSISQTNINIINGTDDYIIINDKPRGFITSKTGYLKSPFDSYVVGFPIINELITTTAAARTYTVPDVGAKKLDEGDDDQLNTKVNSMKSVRVDLIDND